MALPVPLYFLVAIALPGALTSTDDKNLGIIGGHDVFIEDAPYMAAIYDPMECPRDIYCGGSIIHERFILTAAHCFINDTDTSKRVLVGSDRLNSGGVSMNVEVVLCHEEYDDDTMDNDICLLKLEEPIELGFESALVELPDEDFELEPGTLVNITGWGLINVNDSSNELKQVTVPMVSEEFCSRVYGPLNTTVICAGSPGLDSCQGDSGGPLTYGNVQVGVVSYGKNCAIYPGVYTRVTSYLDWIKETIDNNLQD